MCYSITDIWSFQILINIILYLQGYNNICYKTKDQWCGCNGDISIRKYTDIANIVSMKDQHECCYTWSVQVYFITDYAVTTVEYIGHIRIVTPVIGNNICYYPSYYEEWSWQDVFVEIRNFTQLRQKILR